MRGGAVAFFSESVGTQLVRHGADHWLPPDRDTGAEQHTLRNVYREMLLQICRDYTSLPEPRSLRLSEIRFFYAGMREELKRRTKPRPSKNG